MQIIELFPTPIVKFKLPRTFTPEELHFINEEGKQTRYNPGNRTSFNTHVLLNKEMCVIYSLIQGMLNNYMEKVISPAVPTGLRVTQSWINYTKPSGFHHCHYHPNSLVSGVLYISDSPEQITFYKQGSDFWHFGVNVPNKFNLKEAVIDVEKGDVVLFPSSLYHEVKSCKDDNLRISLAFNTFPEGVIGEVHQLTRITL